MRKLRYVLFLALLAAPLALAKPAQAQVAVGIGIGPEVGYPGYYDVGGPPVCDYGYYSYYPYSCAPYGYWGPDWFYGGVFIGAGPWYHGWGHPYYPARPYARGFYGRGYERGPVGRGGVEVRGPVAAYHGGGGIRGGFHGRRR